MKSTLSFRSALYLTSAVLLTGCTPPPSDHGPGPLVVGPTDPPPTHCASQKDPQKVIRIFMPIISPNNMVRDVEYADAASNQDETIEETTDETQTPANSHNYPATGTPVNAPFHIDLTDKSLGNSPGVGLSPGDNVEVRVVMTKSAPYTFDTSEGYLGIGVPDASKTNICNAKIHFRSNGLQTLTFLVTRAASGTAVKPLEPFNLVIDVPGDIDTPMFIDPKILNPG